MIKNILKMKWFDGENKNFTIGDSKEVCFKLSLKDLLIGELKFIDGMWHFEYSDEFKSQSVILPLVNFPDKYKSYVKKDLWPFFTARIPSMAQRQDLNQDDIDVLLKR